MFASIGLYHWPEIEKHRPVSVTESWVNQAKAFLAESGQTPNVFASPAGRKIDTEDFNLINCTLQPSGSALLFSTKDTNAGYAVRESAKPMQKAVFSFSVMRAPGASGQGRHGNAFLVFGLGSTARDLIECRLYYGGRSSMMITGNRIEHVEEKVDFDRQRVFTVSVTVDCESRTVTFEAAGHKLASKITEPINTITHYGYGGANSANLFTGIRVK
jgi:hypothetical protein